MKTGLWIHLLCVAALSAAAYSGLMWTTHAPSFTLADKVQHFVFIGGIAFWWTAGWEDPRLRLLGAAWPVVPITVFVLSSCEEALQSLSPYRDANVFDGLANLLGVLTFWWLGRRWTERRAAPAASPHRISETP